MLTVKCEKNDQFEIIRKNVCENFFNVMAKNFVSETNPLTHSKKKDDSKRDKPCAQIAKIRKLQSEN